MPLVKSDALPLGQDEVSQLRARLTAPYAAELVERDDRRYLCVRSPRTDPDPVLDVDAALESAPPWALATINDVLLLGARSDLHVPAHIVRPVAEQIAKADDRIARDIRARLDVHYGIELHRVASDPIDFKRLLIRIPRDRCTDLSESDLLTLAERLGDWLDGDTSHIRTCHVVAQQDALRLPATDVIEDLRQRWGPLRDKRALDASSTPPAPPSHEKESPRPRPTVVEDVTPAFEIEQELTAHDPEIVETDAAKRAQSELALKLQAVGYTIHPAPPIPGAPFAFEARRALAFPRTVAAVTLAHLDREQADRLLQLARESGLDLLYAIVGEATSGAEKRLATSKVKVLKSSRPPDVTP